MRRKDGKPATTSAAINLGIAISGATLNPGETRTLPEIAAFAGTSKQAIQQIERKAIQKLRNKLRALGITP